MSITVAVQNNKAMQAYAKLKKQLQQDNIIRIYRNKRYFMTAQQKVQTKISMRVMRAKALKWHKQKMFQVHSKNSYSSIQIFLNELRLAPQRNSFKRL